MALRPVGYRSLTELLQRERLVAEDPETLELMRTLRGVRRRGSFTRREFLAMCRWKSPRARPHCERNPAFRVRRVSGLALATRSERRRLELLTGLHGVSVPMASAILTLIDPRRYGVLDIRVWQLLFRIRSVRWKPRGQGFTFRDWDRFLTELRHHARRLGVSVRTVEHTLFWCHRRLQAGTLYARGRRSRAV